MTSKSFSQLFIAIFGIIIGGSTFLFPQKPILIDERQDSLVISQIIKIDEVWSGHPVGFCLLTKDDLSYMKSPDLIHWYDAYGEPIQLSATLEQKSLIADPIPPGGGIINLAVRLVLDDDRRPVFVFHKYDGNGNLQLYIAQFGDDDWQVKSITNWDYRWEFSGRGSIDVDVRIKGFIQRSDGNYEIDYWHIKHGNETLLLDQNFEVIGKVLKPKSLSETLSVEGDFPGLEVRISSDLGGAPEEGVKYMLKWETLDRNRDRPRPKPWPAPSKLYLYKME